MKKTATAYDYRHCIFFTQIMAIEDFTKRHESIHLLRRDWLGESGKHLVFDRLLTALAAKALELDHQNRSET
jgi:hypothetical protein